jgi:general stress protein 26
MMKTASKLAEHLWKKLEGGPFMMLGLVGHGHAVPLTAQLDKDETDRIWFFVGKDNRLVGGGAAMGQFVSKGQDFFACLAGSVAMDNDPAKIDKLWNRQVEAWFPGGKTDPNLALIRLDIDEAELWETDLSLKGRLNMLLGGKIHAEDEGSHAKVQTTAA